MASDSSPQRFRQGNVAGDSLEEEKYMKELDRVLELERECIDVHAADLYEYDQDLYNKMVRYPLKELAIFEIVLMDIARVGQAPFDSGTTTVSAGSVVRIPGMNPKDRPPKFGCYIDKVADDEAGGDPVDRKRRHREVEKQRRKEMTCLYSDLRSKPPQELNKRSISDLMNEARNYISHMQSKVRDLNLRRDELKRICNSSFLDYYSKNDTAIEVLSWEDGLHVVISGENGILASTVLKVLSERLGLNVVSSILTKVNGKMLLTNHCEAGSIDSKFDIIQIKRHLKEAMDRRQGGSPIMYRLQFGCRLIFHLR